MRIAYCICWLGIAWSPVTGHWSLVTGHRSLVTRHWSLRRSSEPAAAGRALGLGGEYACEQAAEPRTALQLAARTPPAAVVLDLRLRGGDGLDLLAALRREPALARVPVVIFSSSADQPAVGRRLAALPAAGPVARVPKSAGVRGLRLARGRLVMVRARHLGGRHGHGPTTLVSVM